MHLGAGVQAATQNFGSLRRNVKAELLSLSRKYDLKV